MSLSSAELREKITALDLSRADFARWLQVSPGAVAQWLSEARSIPGPVNAFLKLFDSLPPSLQQRQLFEIKKGSSEMEGMYVIEFAGSAGQGGATLTFKNGAVYGFDLGGGIYDGRYGPSSRPGMTQVEVAVKMPAGQPSVIRGIVQPFDWTVLAAAEIPTNCREATVAVTTNMGEVVNANFVRMRGVPMAA
ncbi:hypothetical protein ACQQ2Q_22390 [Agrobacterium sp. ES01]|uniref:hypothetical protein n=1 Tax=Agrobacterium sp. ES01 TaxID=3420714 RepID=UPI003D119A35